MKTKFITLSVLLISALSANAQTWIGVRPNRLFTSPDSTVVGIGTSNPSEKLDIVNGNVRIGDNAAPLHFVQDVRLKFAKGEYVQLGTWESNTTLSFKANKYNFTNGNVGIGISNPQYKLDVNGKVFLHTLDYSEGWAQSYLQWEHHKLIMGVPAGTYAHTLVDLIPGGCSEEPLFSQLSLYHAYSTTQKEETMRFCTSRDSWINNDYNFGIGTNTPQYKLDVRGTIRANEVLVNNVNGADFVFEDGYYLRPLSEVNSYIQANQHLPEIPSAKEMQENGVNMNELQMQLLQKVEELTLYVIQQEQRIKELESMVSK